MFRKNVQGDVTHIYKLTGTTLELAAMYKYDAWGKCEVVDSNQSGIGEVNPIRYRGYFYDTETGLYYLNARYYDPETGRFISADDTQFLEPNTTNGLNLYAYCGNNPVMNIDPSGMSWDSFWKGVGDWFKDNWVKLVVGAAFILGGAIVTFFTAGMGTAGLLAAGGALLASLKSVGISMAVSAGIGACIGGITGGWEGALQGFSNGLADGFMWGGIFAGGAQALSGCMKVTRNLAEGFNGKVLGKIKLWSPNAATNPNIGGTLIKFGKYSRIDVEVKRGLHMALKLFGKKINHIPLGMIMGGIFGGLFN